MKQAESDMYVCDKYLYRCTSWSRASRCLIRASLYVAENARGSWDIYSYSVLERSSVGGSVLNIFATSILRSERQVIVASIINMVAADS